MVNYMKNMRMHYNNFLISMYATEEYRRNEGNNGKKTKQGKEDKFLFKKNNTTFLKLFKNFS